MNMQLEVGTIVEKSYSVPYFLSTDDEIKSILAEIINNIGQLLFSTIKIYCLNRERQRRQLAHLISQWDDLQQRLSASEINIHHLIDSESKKVFTYC